jgi:hypothetical protein
MCSYAAKKFRKIKQLLKQQFLIHLTYALCKIIVVEYSYQNFN